MSGRRSPCLISRSSCWTRSATSVESMVELAEDRVSEINALLEVAVEEAEETFFSTAAIMRALRLGGRGRKRRRSPRAERRRLG